MGGVEAKLGNLAQRLLMPKEVPPEFARGRPASFPEAPANSLLLLAHIALEVPDTEAARKFYVEGLGAGLLPDLGKELRLHAGVSHFQLSSTDDGTSTQQRLAQQWPGHIYCWVEDSNKTFADCQALNPELVEEAHSNTSETNIDALVLQDPAALNRFVINPAPKGRLVNKIRSLGSLAAERKTTNLLAIIDATHLIAPGTSDAVKRCYEHFLGAAVSRKRDGYALLFSLGQSLHQTLTFVEDESVSPIVQSEVGQKPVPGICIYMPTVEMFRSSFQRCSDAGILSAGPSTLQEAEAAHEFSFQKCVDPQTNDVVLELLHIVRIQQHAECPLPAGQIWRKDKVVEESKDDLLIKRSVAEVRKHNKTEDAWIIINGKVYDLTDWVGRPPFHGVCNLGRDVSQEWNSMHPPGTWEEQFAYPNGPRIVGFVDDETQDDFLAGA